MTEENTQHELSESQEALAADLPSMIRLFHLSNGDVVLATVESYTSEFAIVWRPFVIHRAYDAMGSLLGFEMQPYLSDLVDEEELIPLNLSLVFAVVAPSMDLMKYYIATSLIPGSEDDEDYDESGSEEYLQSEENKTEQSAKKRILH